MIYNIVNIIISRQVVRNRFVAMVHFTTMLVIWKEPGSWKMNYNRTKLFNSSKVQLEPYDDAHTTRVSMFQFQ